MAEKGEVLRCTCGQEIGTVQGDVMTFEVDGAVYQGHAPVEFRCRCGRMHVWLGEDDGADG